MILRSALILAVAAAACICLATGACATPNDFIISFWCGPIPSEPVDARYAEVAEAGFNITQPPCASVTVKDNLAILDACEKLGIKAFIGDERIFARDSGDPLFEKNLDSVIADYSKKPALYGYHIMDEPGPGLFGKLAAINAYLLKKDPAHLPYINLYPNYVAPHGIGGVSYPQHVEDYLSTVKPKLLSYDHYALVGDGERAEYFDNLEVIRAGALKHGIPWMNIILSTPHFGYRNPSMADLRWQVYTTLAYGATGIAYFTYWTPDPTIFRNGIINEKGERTEHYEMVKKLNAEIRSLAPTLLKLESVGVYHTGKLPISTRALPADTLIKGTAGADLVIGLFKGPNDSDWFMLTNRDIRKPASAVVTLAAPGAKVMEISKTTGKPFAVPESDLVTPGVLKLKFEAGEGRLFMLVADR